MRRFLIVAAAIFFFAGQAFGRPTGVPLNLEQMARLKFPAPPLSAAEQRVVRAAPDGTTAECSNLGGDVEPEKADGSPEAPGEKWPETRNVRADLIRWLLVDHEARKQVDPKGVWILGARITGHLDLSFTNALFPLVLAGCRLEQGLDLRYAKMPLLSLAGSWTGAIDADGLKLEGNLFLRSGFHAVGEVRLLGASVGGDLDATGGTFNNSNGDALMADRIEVRGNIFLRNDFNPFLRKDFHAEGQVRLLGATIGRDLDAKGGTFRNPKGNALYADGIEVGGNVFLQNGFSAEGEVSLPGAEIKGQLAVIDAWMDGLILDSAHVTGPFIWRDIHKDSDPRFPNKKWKPSLDLTDAKVGPLEDDEASWPEKGRLRLNGFVYDRIAAGPTDAKRRLRWLHLQPNECGYLPQPYEQLIAVLRQMGHEDQIAEVAIAKQEDLYEHGGLGWWGKRWKRFLYHAVRYGYEPWRAFGWMAALVIVGTLVFLLARLLPVPVLVPSDKEAYESDEKTEKAPPPHYYPKFNALVYSLDVIFPFDLGQKSHWRLSERQRGAVVYWIFEVWWLFQLVAGWALLLIAAGVLAGLIK